MAANIPPTEQDYDLLSAYLDNQLSAADRTQFEKRLAAEPTLRTVLNELQQTVAILKATPQLALPRNFTLDVARYRRPTPWWARYRTMQLIGALGTAASIVLIFLGATLFSANQAMVPVSAPYSTAKDVASNSVAAVPTQTETIAPTVAALANKAILPTATLVLPTLVPTRIAAEGGAQLASTPTLAQYSAQSAPPAPGVMSAQSAQVTAPPTQPLTSESHGRSSALAPVQPTLQFALTAVTPNSDQQFAATSTTNEANTGASDAAGFVSSTATPAPTMTTTPSATASVTKTQLPTETRVAVVPTQAPTPLVGSATTPQAPAAPPVLLIVGIALLVFSVMIFGIGWLRSRLRG
jgi:hypothetical protein